MATQLAKSEPQNTAVAPVQDMSGGILAVIERAARDPSVDIDKLERLLEMSERVQARNAEAEFNAALAVMQPELPTIDERGGIKDRNGNVQSKYALWEDVNEAIRPVLSKYGFALNFKTRMADGKITVTGILRHSAGHSDTTEMELPADTSGSKNAVQSIGSSVSYGKRYTAYALLNITTGGEDDDGARGGARTINDRQLQTLQDLIDDTGSDVRRFCAFFKVEALPDLPAAKYEEAVRQLNAKASKPKTGGAE